MADRAPYRFRIQYRYQDSRWRELGEAFNCEHEACWRAAQLSLDSMCYGMVRVVHVTRGAVVEFNAGATDASR